MSYEKRPIPTITVGQLREELAPWHDNDLISFSGLSFYRVKGRGEQLAQIEFNELIYLDDAGNGTVQSPK